MSFFSNITNKENFFTDTPYGFGQNTSVEKNESPVTVPMVESQPSKPQAQLDSTGNVPIVKNVKADETMGLGVEKTTVTNEPSAQTTKTGESIDERLTRYYGKYKNATKEEKKAFLKKYITQSYSEIKGKTRAEQIKIQLGDYKKLLSNTKEGDSYEMLAEKIDILEKENQVLAAKSATTEQASPELRKRGEIGVARTIHNCDSANQIELTDIVVNSKNEQAIKIGASHSSELSDENQVKAVDIYKTADISEKAKTEVGKTIVDQYADFASENQVEIHKSMSDKNYWNTQVIESAAANIYKFDAENQKPAVQVTVNTGNEAAIAAAAAKINYYDKTVQSDIKTTLADTGITSVKEALATAPQPPETKTATTTTTATAKTDNAAPKTATTPIVSNIALAAQTQEKFEKASLSQKMQMLSSMNGSEKEAYMKNIIKSAPPAVVLALLSTLPSSMLSSVINIVLDSSPSMEVMSKVTSLIGKVPDGDKKSLIKKINNSYSTSLLNSQASRFDADAQKVVVQEMARKGRLDTFSQYNWSTSTKEFYKNLVKTQEKNG